MGRYGQPKGKTKIIGMVVSDHRKMHEGIYPVVIGERGAKFIDPAIGLQADSKETYYVSDETEGRAIPMFRFHNMKLAY